MFLDIRSRKRGRPEKPGRRKSTEKQVEETISAKIARRKIDWETIYREYRADQFSIREIARQCGCSEGAIRKKAKAMGWKRDLGERVRQAVGAKLFALNSGR